MLWRREPLTEAIWQRGPHQLMAGSLWTVRTRRAQERCPPMNGIARSAGSTHRSRSTSNFSRCSAAESWAPRAVVGERDAVTGRVGMSGGVRGLLEAASRRAHDSTGAPTPTTRGHHRPQDPIADWRSPGPHRDSAPARYGWYAPSPAASLLASPEGSYLPSNHRSTDAPPL